MLFAIVTWQATDHNEIALPYVYEAKASVHFPQKSSFWDTVVASVKSEKSVFRWTKQFGSKVYRD